MTGGSGSASPAAASIDLARITKLARLGIRDVSKVARLIGVPRSTLVNAVHAESVKEAFETGRAQFEMEALEQYAEDIARNRRNPLVIFKMKQLGWSDKVQQLAPGGSDVTGARDRLRQLIEQKRAMQAASATS